MIEKVTRSFLEGICFVSPVRKLVLQQRVSDQLRSYLCRWHNTFLTQISSNNVNEAAQIAFDCLSEELNIKAIGQILNLFEEKIVYKSFNCVSLK